MRFLIVYNLAAGTGDSAIFDFERALIADGDEVVMRVTDGHTDVISLVADAKEFDAVVIAGGDGTVSSALYAMRNSGVPVLPFPAGTTNLLTLNIDNPTEPVALAKLTRDLTWVDFDLGELDLHDRAAPAAGGNAIPGPAALAQRSQAPSIGFDIIAGAGFDATIMEQAVSYKQNLGPAAYLAAALANPKPQVAHFTLDLDGEVVESEGIAVLLIDFGKMLFDLTIIPGYDPRDGQLDVVVVKAQNTAALFPIVTAAIFDREGRNPRPDSLEVHRAREVRVTADPPLTIQFDGEPTGMLTPLVARALPHATRLIVTKQFAQRAAAADAARRSSR